MEPRLYETLDAFFGGNFRVEEGPNGERDFVTPNYSLATQVSISGPSVFPRPVPGKWVIMQPTDLSKKPHNKWLIDFSLVVPNNHVVHCRHEGWGGRDKYTVALYNWEHAIQVTSSPHLYHDEKIEITEYSQHPAPTEEILDFYKEKKSCTEPP